MKSNELNEITYTLETTYQNETWEHSSIDDFKIEYEKSDNYFLSVFYSSSSLIIDGNNNFCDITIKVSK